MSLRRLVGRALALLPQKFVDQLDLGVTFHFVANRILKGAIIIGPARYEKRQEVWRVAFDRFVGSRDAPVRYFEFGVYRGESIAWWAKQNAHRESRFFGFDSFTGLPEAWKTRGIMSGHFDTGGQPPAIDDPRVSFVKGLFSDTLADFFATYEDDPAAKLIFHFDADLFSSTLQAGLVVTEKFKGREMLWLFDEFFPDEASAFMVLQQLRGFRFRPLCSDAAPLRVALTVET